MVSISGITVQDASEYAVIRALHPLGFFSKRTIFTIQGTHSRYKKLAVQWLNVALCFVPSSVLADSSVLRNRRPPAIRLFNNLVLSEKGSAIKIDFIRGIFRRATEFDYYKSLICQEKSPVSLPPDRHPEQREGPQAINRLI